MGCTGSKEARRQRHRSPSPLPRCHSMPVIHPAQRKGDSCHVVALTSTTLGSLRLDAIRERCGHRGCPQCGDPDDAAEEPMKKTLNDRKGRVADGGFSAEVEKAKAWSEMLERRIPAPRTPTNTPPNEPEVINTWEMMEGLEDASPLHGSSAAVERSFSFHSVQDAREDGESKPKARLSNGSVSPEPMWMQVDGHGEEDGAVITEFDPNIISSFRKAFLELSPQHPFHLRSQQPSDEDNRRTEDVQKSPDLTGIVQARISAFQGKIDARKKAQVAAAAATVPCLRPPGGEGKVVFYFTSLRGVRRTYEDCCAVRVILRGYAVRVDERDVSMHGGFKEELNAILGPEYGGSRLPRVFANGRYLGGVEEVRLMHDAGELWEALKGCEEVAVGKDGSCRACGDVRFVPCETCSGSCKVYVEEEEKGKEEGEKERDGDGREEEMESGGFRRCPDCNENGLVRCPICCSS